MIVWHNSGILGVGIAQWLERWTHDRMAQFRDFGSGDSSVVRALDS